MTVERAGEVAANCLLSILSGLFVGFMYIMFHDAYCMSQACDVLFFTEQMWNDISKSQTMGAP
jgi:hypothetical protein